MMAAVIFEGTDSGDYNTYKATYRQALNQYPLSSILPDYTSIHSGNGIFVVYSRNAFIL
jgi:hypothetical protein